MKQLKKLTAVVFAVLVLLGVAFGSATTAYAADNQVTDIDIEVVIREDGSAYIIQYWTGEFHDGTENYIPIRTGDIGISFMKSDFSHYEYHTRSNSSFTSNSTIRVQP